MAKKEFKRVNPAEAFITIPEEEPVEGQTDNLNNSSEKMPNTGEIPENVVAGEKVAEDSLKKPLEKPAKEAAQSERIIAPTAVPKGYKLNPKFIETKSRKVQLLLQPSVVESIKALSRENGVSMNEAINQAIQEYVARHTENHSNL